MAKRFTDTEMWDKEWFMALNCKLKCLVKLVRDKADLCGVWSPNWIIASTYIGEPVNENDLLLLDGGNQFKKLGNNKIFCIGFIEFQYGELSEKSPVHRKIMSLLTQNNLLEDYKKLGCKYPIDRVQEEEEDKDKDKDKEKEDGEIYKNSGDGKLFTIEHCVVVALNDERWVRVNKTNKQELEEFNRVLEKRGHYQKNPMDYKTHFANWKATGKKDLPKNESPPSGPSPSELRALEILNSVA